MKRCPGTIQLLALQQEIEDMPAFRKYNGFTAFIEGWALYSERLGLETGFYEDPYSDFRSIELRDVAGLPLGGGYRDTLYGLDA